MKLFFLSFLLIYGAIHFFAYSVARRATGFGTAAAVLVTGVMLVMIAAPFLVRMAEHAGKERLGCFLAYVGYSWMGLLFLFVSAAIPLKIWNLAAGVGSFIHRKPVLPLLPAQQLFYIPLVFAVVCYLYGLYEATHVRIEEVVVRSPKVPQGPPLRVVQISDVHMGLIVRGNRMARIGEAIRNAAPDILVSTGDLVDGQIDGLSGPAGMLAAISPPKGKFGVTGNHEIYAGPKQSLTATQQAGFRVLRGEAVEAAGIIVAGVDDPAAAGGRSADAAERQLLSTLPDNRFILLLKHRPQIESGSLGQFDLQLSGHVHKGQIFPFNLMTRVFYPIRTGYSELDSGSSIYVSRGTGTWGPPIRFLAPPEITVFQLVNSR